MMRYLATAILLLVLVLRSSAQSATPLPSIAEHSGATPTYRMVDAPNITFGYGILSNGRLFVHQTNMPGNEGCRTREQAEPLARLVIGKVQKGEMPAAVTATELKALNIR